MIHLQEIIRLDMLDGTRGVIDTFVGYDDPAVGLAYIPES